MQMTTNGHVSGRGNAGDIKSMKALFTEAISFPGFSFVDVISPCPTYRGGMGQFKELRQIVNYLTPENHDIHDWDKAHALTRDKSRLHVGVIYQEPRASYMETQHELQLRAQERKFPPMEAIADNYK
jgi:2-oxoglutarate ferredoxin oxidoreductase subunit beta